MIVVTAMTAVIMVAITDSVIFFYRANTSSIEQAYQVESARVGMLALVKDLREATYGDDGSYPLAQMASTSLTFYADTDSDNAVEKVHYELNGLSLTRTVTDETGTPPTYVGGAAATSTVSDHVRNVADGVYVFRYYRADGTEATTSASIGDVQSVTITLVVDITPKHAPGEFTLTSGATFRNLRIQN